jgi:hypothetical protein
MSLMEGYQLTVQVFEGGHIELIRISWMDVVPQLNIKISFCL